MALRGLPAPGTTVFETRRLSVRVAAPADADLYVALWTDPRVMRFVGFPEGIPTTRKQVLERMGEPRESRKSEFGVLLVVARTGDGEAIGGGLVGKGTCVDHAASPYPTCQVPYLLYRVYRADHVDRRP